VKVAIFETRKVFREWQVRNQIRETPIEQARKRRRDNEQKAQRPSSGQAPAAVHPPGNGESLPPAGISKLTLSNASRAFCF
jgi:hypothetical protein